VGTGQRGADDPGARAQPRALAQRCTADQRQRSAVDDAGGISGGVHVVDALDPVVFLQGYSVETTQLTHPGEGGFETAERVDSRSRTHVFVVVEHGLAVAV